MRPDMYVVTLGALVLACGLAPGWSLPQPVDGVMLNLQDVLFVLAYAAAVLAVFLGVINLDCVAVNWVALLIWLAVAAGQAYTGLASGSLLPVVLAATTLGVPIFYVWAAFMSLK